MYRAHFRVTTVAALLSLAVAGATPLAAQSTDPKQDKKQQEAQRVEIQGLMLATDQAMTQGVGETPAAFALTPDGKKTPKVAASTDAAPAMGFRHDLLKAQQGKIYVPFTVTVEPGKLGTNSVAMYVRVVPKGAAAPTEEERKQADKDKPPFPFEDIYFVDLKPQAAGLPPSLSRAFAVPAGEYDVYVAVKPQVGVKELPKGTILPVAVSKHTVTVPDFWNGELTTSSIMVADKIDAATQLAPEEQREHPYVLGGAEITPAVDHKFSKGEELLILFQIYNPAPDENGKPDVTVEYEFHKKDGDAEKLFNKMNPQEFNAKTLPANFDPKADHQVAAGWGVPLSTFPEGDYRLHIKVKDNKAAKEITRDVNFSVSGS